MDKLIQSTSVPLRDVRIYDSFWSKYVSLVREVIIPYQWEALNDRVPDAEPSYAIRNFRIAAGEVQGEFGGMVFQDSDVAKWLEAVGYSLETYRDQELERLADETIDLIARAQREDGYLNTYFLIKEPGKEWTNLWECHELYSAGHMIEAAVAYYKATGKRKIIDIMCKFVDHIDSKFGPEPHKLKGYCGHQEIELALVKLYRATDNEKYLKLAQYFIDERGKEPNYFELEWERNKRISHWTKGEVKKPDGEYNQAHMPVRMQTKAVGHAVRAVYMYTGMADIAAETGDRELLLACQRLWENVTSTQMYITGGIGSTSIGEAFTFDYDLPNDTVYAETCASIGLIFFGFRLLQMEAKSCYSDVIERALYNTVVSGMALDGRHFLYVNPLEVWPEASEKSHIRQHVKPVRQKWFGCACCPPNVARLLSSLGQYIYTVNDDTIYAHLYIGGEAELQLKAGKIKIQQKTEYPWEGKVEFKISSSLEFEFSLGLRLPGWCRMSSITINGKSIGFSDKIVDGYAILKRNWKDGDSIVLEMEMPVEIIHANPKVRADAGKVAIQRGPLVYCLEETDNGANLSTISLPTNTKLAAAPDDEISGIITITGDALRKDESTWGEQLYRPYIAEEKKVHIKTVPYYFWGNRKPGEMTVWIGKK